MPPKAQTHNPGHPCLGVPERSMIICNYDGRIKSNRQLATMENLVRTTSFGVFFEANNSGLADKAGDPVLIAASENGANPLVNDNCNDNTYIKDNVINPDPPEDLNCTELGTVVCRNSFAHVAGPKVAECNGEINYHLDLRGYNKNGGQSREKDDYAGMQLYHDGSDGIIVLSSGSETTITNPGQPNQDIEINYEAGQTMRMRISGIATALPSRTLTIERRTNDSVEGGANAIWHPVVMFSP